MIGSFGPEWEPVKRFCYMSAPFRMIKKNHYSDVSIEKIKET